MKIIKSILLLLGIIGFSCEKQKLPKPTFYIKQEIKVEMDGDFRICTGVYWASNDYLRNSFQNFTKKNGIDSTLAKQKERAGQIIENVKYIKENYKELNK